MSRSRAWIAGVCVAVVAAGAGWLDDVPASGAADCGLVVFGITEGPDPIPYTGWVPLSVAGQSLNPGGTQRGDGRPDVACCDSIGRPVVVWAYNAGTDHDVAFAEWNGSSWSAVTFLTSSLVDEVDPRAAATPDGAVHVTWWEDAAPARVLYARRSPTGTWSQPIAVTSSGRRPSVAFSSGKPLVAFERPSGGATQIVLATTLADGTFAEQVVATTSRTEPLDPIVHVEGQIAWIDWKHSASTFGWVRRQSTSPWSGVATTAWTDPSWNGQATVRATIRAAVLAP